MYVEALDGGVAHAPAIGQLRGGGHTAAPAGGETDAVDVGGEGDLDEEVIRRTVAASVLEDHKGLLSPAAPLGGSDVDLLGGRVAVSARSGLVGRIADQGPLVKEVAGEVGGVADETAPISPHVQDDPIGIVEVLQDEVHAAEGGGEAIVADVADAVVGLTLDAKVIVEHTPRLHEAAGDLSLPHIDVKSLRRVARPVAIGTDVEAGHQIDMPVVKLMEHLRHELEESKVVGHFLLLHEVDLLTVGGVDRVPVDTLLIEEAVALVDNRPERLKIGSVVGIHRLRGDAG